MKSRFVTDPQDPSDGFLNTAGAEVYTNFFPSPAADVSVEIVAHPALTSEAVASSSAQSGPTSVVSLTTGGIIINLLFDAAAMAAPASFRAGIQQAAAILTAAISDKITVNIKIDYSGTGGGAAAGPDNGLYESYTYVRANLIDNATPGDTIFNALQGGSSIQGQSNVAVWNAQLKLWGVLGANDTTTDDGSATFATDINPNLLVGVALHELTHAMGRVPYGPPYGSQPDIFDLFRFTSPGTRLISGSNTAPAAYFSVDGGNTKLADFGRNSDPSDFLNSGVQGANDPFNEYYTGNTIQALSAVDKQQLDALGFHTAALVSAVIEALGSTSLVEVGSNFFLDSISSGTGPPLKLNGANFVAGQLGAWTPIGAEQTSTGYEVALKFTGADQYTIWDTDSNGNYVSSPIGVVPGSSAALKSLEPGFHQDLNGDGVIGVPTTVIEALGSTSLVEIGSNFFLDSISSGIGPALKLNGANFVAGQLGAWTPIGAEQTSTGYEVALKFISTDQYTIWNTDSNGNYVSSPIGVVPGSSAALKSLEPGFHQDLNGDGVVGIPTTVIEAFGSTSLAQVGNNYFLDSISSGTGPELKLNGANFVAGQLGAWTPIGAEQTSTGYEVALKFTGTDQYTIWDTDSNGNYVSSSIGVVSGPSTSLVSLEPGFHQDLNGDGVIGIPTTVIEAFGSTSLVEVGSNFFLDSISSGTGPALKLNGANFVAGQLGAWTPIGAELTSTGYEVALKCTGSDQYTIWNTDINGNYVSSPIGVVSGTSASLKSLEPSFYQDLNGDGLIGIPAASSGNPSAQAAVVTVASRDTFVFHPGGGVGIVANAGSEDTIELDGFSSVTGNQLAALLQDTQSGQSQALFHSANEGHDIAINLGSRDKVDPMNSHIADLNAGNFIIH